MKILFLLAFSSISAWTMGFETMASYEGHPPSHQLRGNCYHHLAPIGESSSRSRNSSLDGSDSFDNSMYYSTYYRLPDSIKYKMHANKHRKASPVTGSSMRNTQP